MWRFLTILLVCVFLGRTQADLFTCPNTNTICMPARGPNCLDDSNPARGLSDTSLEDYIVALHNTYRSKVAAGAERQGLTGTTIPQPGSRCMAKLAWSADLALTAQAWADQCRMASDTNRDRNITGTDTYAGQNIYAYIDPVGGEVPATRYPELDYWKAAIDNWYSEVASFNGSTVGSYVYSAATGHYTQMVWGRTTLIGCGFRRWILSDTDRRYGRVLVCNYWPGGNRVGDPIYQTTTSATPVPSCTANTCSTATASSFTGRRIFGNGHLCQ